MTTQAHTYKPGDLLQVPATFTEEQLAAADLENLRKKQADPFGQQRADTAFRRDFQRQEFQDRMNGWPR
jgi:hypothetical protein